MSSSKQGLMVFMVLGFFLWGSPEVASGASDTRVAIRPPAPGAAPSNEYKNVKAAIEFLFDCGAVERAKVLEEKLAKGELGYDPEQNENGDTNIEGDITVNSGIIGHTPTTGVTEFDPDHPVLRGNNRQRIASSVPSAHLILAQVGLSVGP